MIGYVFILMNYNFSKFEENKENFEGIDVVECVAFFPVRRIFPTTGYFWPNFQAISTCKNVITSTISHYCNSMNVRDEMIVFHKQTQQ
jgi:hypothetical protein